MKYKGYFAISAIFIFFTISLLFGILYISKILPFGKPDKSRKQNNESSWGKLLKKHNSKICYIRWDEQRQRDGIYIATSEGEIELPSLFEGNCITPKFSPDGNAILFSCFDGNDFELIHCDLKKMQSKALTDNDDDDLLAKWDSQGEQIVWNVAENGLKENKDFQKSLSIFVSNWPVFKPRKLVVKDVSFYPEFAQNGKTVVFERGFRKDGQVGLCGINMIPSEGGNVKEVFYSQKSGNGIPSCWNDEVVFEGTVKLTESGECLLFECFFIDLEDLEKKVQFSFKSAGPANVSPVFSKDGQYVIAWFVNKKKVPYLTLFKRTSKENLPFKKLKSFANGISFPLLNSNSKLTVGLSQTGMLGLVEIENPKKTIHLKGKLRSRQFLELYNYDIY